VHPEDTIRSDAPAAVSTETKPKIRSSVPLQPSTTAPARKANPYAKYWDRPVGSTHGDSKTITKDDLADSPAGPSRMVTKPKVESIAKTKPKPIIKTSNISGMDGAAGAGHKRTACGAGLSGPGEDKSAEGNAAQKSGQKKKRTIESGMPKIDKGYTHLIPDCIGESCGSGLGIAWSGRNFLLMRRPLTHRRRQRLEPDIPRPPRRSLTPASTRDGRAPST